MWILYRVTSSREFVKPNIMHEFSMALEVLALAGREAERNKAKSIQEISIEVGDLSGVDADAFESALGLIVKDSILDQARISLVRTAGTGTCNNCNDEFEIDRKSTL